MLYGRIYTPVYVAPKGNGLFCYRWPKMPSCYHVNVTILKGKQ